VSAWSASSCHALYSLITNKAGRLASSEASGTLLTEPTLPYAEPPVRVSLDVSVGMGLVVRACTQMNQFLFCLLIIGCRALGASGQDLASIFRRIEPCEP
jgi:hypothetical protein